MKGGFQKAEKKVHTEMHTLVLHRRVELQSSDYKSPALPLS